MQIDSAARAVLVPPDRVAQIGYDGLMRGKRVVIAGFGNKIAVMLLRFVPHALLLWMVDQRKRDTQQGSERAR
jgi:hypothetical protein